MGVRVRERIGRLFGWQFRHAESNVDGPIPPRPVASRRNPVPVTQDSALRHSAVWAAIRLRANLMSSWPCDVFRSVNGIDVEVPKPPILVDPGGAHWDYVDWMYATQVDLDRVGNTIGLITERHSFATPRHPRGLPARIDLQATSDCTVKQRRGVAEPEYWIAGKKYSPDEVYHERQYVIAGLPVGLSPIAYAALTIGEYLSIQQFILDWFGGGAVPKARLKHKERSVPPRESALVKERWNQSVVNGDLFVHGNDWEYDMMQAEQVGNDWMDARRYGLSDAARFFDVTSDLIEAAISAPGTLTYANAISKNLQFLVMSMGPATQRREKNLSKLLQRPRFVKLNTDALLRMDPKTRAEVIWQKIQSRTMTVTEAREKDNLPPLTAEQEAEFVRLFGAPRTAAEPVSRGADWPWAGWEQVSPLSAAPYTPAETS